MNSPSLWYDQVSDMLQRHRSSRPAKNSMNIGGGGLPMRALGWSILAACAVCNIPLSGNAIGSQDTEYIQAIQQDWAAQELRLGREPGTLEALDAAFGRIGLLLDDLMSMHEQRDVQQFREQLLNLQTKRESVEDLPKSQQLDLYYQVRWLGRELALQNPLLAERQIVFLQRRRFICQMLHEYIGYYYNYADLAGGGLFVLEEPGRSFRTRDLIENRLPRGAYATPALAYDGKTVFFAFVDVRSSERDHQLGINWTILPSASDVPFEFNYYSPRRSSFHVYAVDTDGNNLRQLTFGTEDDFDPCPLPNGRLLFMSSRRGGFCRCDNPFEPIPTHTLHQLDANTGQIETVSWHETNEWHPSVLSDGRVVYCRWDYVDRSAAHFHGLWVSNPDGANPRLLFGNYTKNISTCYQPRSVPNSQKIAFIAGAHHANVGGSLVLFDPSKVTLDPQTGEDQFTSLQRLTPEVCFPETSEGWPESFFHSPWPLSEKYYLVAFSFERLPGMGSTMRDDPETGIYYFDQFGNLELLFRQPGVCSLGPMLLEPRPEPPTLPETEVSDRAAIGEYILADVNWSHLPMPQRQVSELRVFQVLPKETTHIANQPRIGLANAEPARLLLGSVPVERDGSAYFSAPANKPLYFQAVDTDGRAVQSMRSVTYLQAGERRSCVGCHETPGSAPPNHDLLALKRGPSIIEPGPDGSHPWSYPRLIQPMLDRHCVECHNGGDSNTHQPVLTDEVVGEFTRSYIGLKPYVRWYEWGEQSITQTVTRPGNCGADASPLTAILFDENHQSKVNLSQTELRRLYLWLDSNVPFYGTYGDDARTRQLAGDAVSAPELQ